MMPVFKVLRKKMEIMKKDNILESVIALLKGFTDTNLEKIHEGSRLKQDLGISSLQFVMIVDKAETMFDVRINDEDLMLIRTVGDLVRCLER